MIYLLILFTVFVLFHNTNDVPAWDWPTKHQCFPQNQIKQYLRYFDPITRIIIVGPDRTPDGSRMRVFWDSDIRGLRAFTHTLSWKM